MIQQVPDCLSAIGWHFEHGVLDDDTEADHDGASDHEQEVDGHVGPKDFVHHLAVDLVTWTDGIYLAVRLPILNRSAVSTPLAPFYRSLN